MSVIERCVYHDGELMAPNLRPTLAAKQRLKNYPSNVFPTFDIGYYHVFRLKAWGRSYQQCEERILRKTRRFYRKMNMVEGFSTLKIDKHRPELIPLNDNYGVTYTIIYVIENTGSRTQDPRSPYPEYREDVNKLTFAPETAANVGL